MYIQYVGFNVAASSRTYNFHVIGPPEEAREFAVKVPSELFRPALLKFQDGPPIAFERVKQELDGETQESHAEAHLNIAELDIHQYLERHHPRKAPKKRPAIQIPPDRPLC